MIGENVFELLNDMIELIYVSDMETYELLFINTAGREKFEITKLDGLKCYKVLQGLEEPCQFCTNKFLNDDDVYKWEITNKITDCHYLLKDKIIDWEGRRARMEVAFDVTEIENERIALKNTLEAEKMVMECAKQLYQTDDFDKSINDILERMGKFLSAQRTYTFDVRNGRMFNEYEWCAEGITPQIKNLQDLDISLIDSWKSAFENNDCMIIENVELLSDYDNEQYKVLKKQNINSLIAAPLEKEGKFSGYLGVDNPPAEKIKNIAPLLHTLRFFLMEALRRVDDKKKLEKLSYHDTLTGFYNRNRFMQDTSDTKNYKNSVGLAFLDINGLKNINDHFGHAYGDRALCNCAKNIAEAFASGDFYRIGGDEFMVICCNISEEKFFEQISELKVRFKNDEECQAAIGFEWAKSGADINELVARADAKMYEDKKQYYHNNPPTNRYRKW